MQITRAERVRLWLPAIAWTAVILLMSGGGGSSETSGGLLRTLLPWLSDATFDVVHLTLRKVAHVVAYSILGLLLFRALREGRSGWRLSWSAIATALAIAVAVIDEAHQASVAQRSGHAADVLLDSASAAAAQVLVMMRARRYP